MSRDPYACTSCGSGLGPGAPVPPAPAPAPVPPAAVPDAAPRCEPRPPTVLRGTVGTFREALVANRRGYTPEWTAGEGDAGSALLAILARELEIQADGLNAMPLRQQLEFLDRLGAGLLPAQSARAPLVFKLLDTATGDATVPAGTRVAAVLPPPAPSLDDGAAGGAQATPEFFTEQEFTAMRGRLAALFTIDPQADLYADHLPAAQRGFALFEGLGPLPHRLYLGHATLFKLAGDARIEVSFDFATPNTNAAGVATRQRPLLLDWEYLSEDGWLPLTLVEDRTRRFTRSGTVVLGKFHGPDATEGEVLGRSSCWIRASVASRTPAARIVSVPATAPWHVKVEDTREILPGDRVTVDGVSTATVLGTTTDEVLLDALPVRARAGEYLELADALPPLRPDGTDEAGTLPSLDVVRARVGLSRTDLSLDSAYLDAFALDVGKDFHPFGRQPEPYAAFYLSCKEAFSRDGARVDLAFRFTRLGQSASPPVVEAEYHDGSRWVAMGPDEHYADDTQGFTWTADMAGPGLPTAVVSFDVPPGWAESAVNGEKARWLRFRLASGDYGSPASVSVAPDPGDPAKFVVTAAASTLHPPVVAELRVSYLVFGNVESLEQCVTDNAFALADHGEDARWHRGGFEPFTPVDDRAPALHFGFDARPPAALVSLLAVVLSPAADAGAQPLAWDYWGERGWGELSVRDLTGGLSRTGLIQFVGPPDAVARDGPGGALFRIRARLKPGLPASAFRVRLGGVWLNAAWASEGTRYPGDTLGTSDGNPDQTFSLPSVRATPGSRADVLPPAANNAVEFARALCLPIAGVPVLEGEAVWIREWTGRGDDWQTAVGPVPEADLRLVTDPRDPATATEAWVRWRGRPHLYDSGPADRHYVVERARGVFRFPGPDGFIPPAGCPITVDYVTGGGVAGNVAAGLIRELRSGVGFVESVSNPVASAGGAAAERLRDARDRGTQALRNRDRAVSAEDYEWLARAATSEVARARALPLEGPSGRGSRGHVGLVIVPQSAQAMPMPSLELQSRVLAYLAARMPAATVGGLRIVAPTYRPVTVRAEVLPLVAAEAGRVEARVRERLARFLHPLTGGRDGRGWEFGTGPCLSDVAALLESTPGVDAVAFLQLLAGGAIQGEQVPLAPDEIVAAGESLLKILVPSVPHAIA